MNLNEEFGRTIIRLSYTCDNIIFPKCTFLHATTGEPVLFIKHVLLISSFVHILLMYYNSQLFNLQVDLCYRLVPTRQKSSQK